MNGSRRGCILQVITWAKRYVVMMSRGMLTEAAGSKSRMHHTGYPEQRRTHAS